MKIGIVDLSELASFVGIGSGRDLRAEELQLGGVLTPNALEHAKRITDRLARVLSNTTAFPSCAPWLRFGDDCHLYSRVQKASDAIEDRLNA